MDTPRPRHAPAPPKRMQVLSKLDALKADFDVEQYGALSKDAERYPLFCVKSRGCVPSAAG